MRVVLAIAWILVLATASPDDNDLKATIASRYGDSGSGIHMRRNSEGPDCSLTATTAEQPSVSTQSAKYQNDGDNTYHCDHGVWIIACPLIGACSAMEFCIDGCIEDKRGAECLTQDLPAISKREIPDIEAQENKRYECSNDHTGVPICRYGFCSTDRYCKKNTKCSDKCACCKNAKEILRETTVFEDSST